MFPIQIDFRSQKSPESNCTVSRTCFEINQVDAKNAMVYTAEKTLLEGDNV